MSCPDCKAGTILEGEPTGVISNIDGAYLAAAPEPTTKRAVLLFTDAFGLPLVNSRLIADSYAKKLSCDVWIPDIFAGKPLIGVDQIEMQRRAGEKRPFLSLIRFYLSMIPSIPALIASRPAVVDKRLTAFIAKLQAEKQYEQIGAFGFCYGGSTACRMAGTDLLKSAVICHPGPVGLDTIKAIKIPVSWVCAEGT
ncbi:hypothetical protein HGRIS_005864 [Hohenbuehelia grisea]|uniref:Dienelactone hydrolase domain-containing protein n=1 Tax=Hohenbuehelia grisea TaxID=104357 RepID=A0ABR3K009_9AGAR